MKQFKNEFLSYADEREKEQIELEIEKEIERLKKEVLSKDDYLVSYGNKTLFLEAFRGKVDRVKTYLKSGKFNVNFAIKYEEVPPYIASHKGHIEEAESNLGTGITPLYMASQEGYTKVVELLLNNEANPNLSRESGETPLFIASQNGHKEIVELLLSEGADPSKARKDNATPLYVVSLTGHTKIAEMLLHTGVDPNFACNDGATPIVVAIFKQNIEIVKLLLPRIDLNMCEWNGKGVKELIEDKIQDEEEKGKLLKTLSSKENPSTSPTKTSAVSVNSRLCNIL